MTENQTPDTGTVRIASVAEQLENEHGRSTFIQPDPVVEDNNEVEEPSEQKEVTTSNNEDESSDEVDNDDPGEVEVEPKHTNGFEKRIERFNRRLTEKNARIEQLERELGKVAPVQQSVQAQQQEKPTLEQFGNDWPKYTEALTDWKVNEAIQNQEFKKTQQAQVQTWQQKEQEYAKTVPDYQEVIDEFKQDYAHVNAPDMNIFLAKSDVGPALWYYLAENRDLTNKLIKMEPIERVAELGALQAQLRGAPKAQVQAPKVSKAPAPISKEKGAPPSNTKISDPNLSQAEYRELRMSQRKNRF